MTLFQVICCYVLLILTHSRSDSSPEFSHLSFAYQNDLTTRQMQIFSDRNANFTCSFVRDCMHVKVVNPPCSSGFLLKNKSKYIKIELSFETTTCQYTSHIDKSPFDVQWIWNSATGHSWNIQRCRLSSFCILPSVMFQKQLDVVQRRLDIQVFFYSSDRSHENISIFVDQGKYRRKKDKNDFIHHKLNKTRKYLISKFDQNDIIEMEGEKKMKLDSMEENILSNVWRSKRAAIDEEADLAVLMQGEKTSDKKKIAEMISSDFSTPEFFDESPVLSSETSDARLSKTSQRLKNMVYDLKIQDSLDGPPKSKHAEAVLKDDFDQVNEDGVSKLQLHDVKQELKKAQEEWDSAQEESKELKEMTKLGHDGFGLIPDGKLKQKIASNIKTLKKAKRRLSLAKEQAISLKLDLDDDLVTQKPKPKPRLHGLIMEPIWGPWNSWSKCSKDCKGGGYQTRRRTCDTLPDIPCDGVNFDMKQCNVDIKCAAQWQEWSVWGPCSVTCGRGMKARSRICTTQDNSVACGGQSSGFKKCDMPVCPTPKPVTVKPVVLEDPVDMVEIPEAPLIREVRSLRKRREIDYSWSVWGAWSACTKKCGKGKRKRQRNCLDVIPDIPVKAERDHCVGTPTQIRPCVGHKCAVPPVAAGAAVMAGQQIVVKDPATNNVVVVPAAAAAAVAGPKLVDDDADDDDDDDGYLAPTTIIFIILLFIAAMIFSISLFCWCRRRSQEAKMKATLAGKKWDDGMDGYGTLKSVLVNTDFCGRTTLVEDGNPNSPGPSSSESSISISKNASNQSVNRPKKSKSPAIGTPSTQYGGLVDDDKNSIKKMLKTESKAEDPLPPEVFNKVKSMDSGKDEKKSILSEMAKNYENPPEKAKKTQPTVKEKTAKPTVKSKTPSPTVKSETPLPTEFQSSEKEDTRPSSKSVTPPPSSKSRGSKKDFTPTPSSKSRGSEKNVTPPLSSKSGGSKKEKEVVELKLGGSKKSTPSQSKTPSIKAETPEKESSLDVSEKSMSSKPQRRPPIEYNIGDCIKPLPLSPSIIPKSTQIDDELKDALKVSPDYIYKSVLKGNMCTESNVITSGNLSFCRDYNRRHPHFYETNIPHYGNPQTMQSIPQPWNFTINETIPRPENIYPSHDNFYKSHVQNIQNIGISQQNIHPGHKNPISFVNIIPGQIEKCDPSPNNKSLSFVNKYPGQISTLSENDNKSMSFIEKSPDKIHLSVKPSPNTAGLYLLTGQCRHQKRKSTANILKQKTRPLFDASGNNDSKGNGDEISKSNCYSQKDVTLNYHNKNSDDGHKEKYHDEKEPVSNTKIKLDTKVTFNGNSAIMKDNDCYDNHNTLNSHNQHTNGNKNDDSQIRQETDNHPDKQKRITYKNKAKTQCNSQNVKQMEATNDIKGTKPLSHSCNNHKKETFLEDIKRKKDYCNETNMKTTSTYEQHDEMIYGNNGSGDTDEPLITIFEEANDKASYDKHSDNYASKFQSNEDLLMLNTANQDSYSLHISKCETIATRTERHCNNLTESFDKIIDKKERDGSHDCWVSNLLSESELLLEQIDEEIDSYSAIYVPNTSLFEMSQNHDESSKKASKKAVIECKKDNETFQLNDKCKLQENAVTQINVQQSLDNSYCNKDIDEPLNDGKLNTLDEMLSENFSNFVSKEVMNKNDGMRLKDNIEDNCLKVNKQQIMGKGECDDMLFEEKKCTILSLYDVSKNTTIRPEMVTCKSKMEKVQEKMSENKLECLDPKCKRFFVKHSVDNCLDEESSDNIQEPPNKYLSDLDIWWQKNKKAPTEKNVEIRDKNCIYRCVPNDEYTYDSETKSTQNDVLQAKKYTLLETDNNGTILDIYKGGEGKSLSCQEMLSKETALGADSDNNIPIVQHCLIDDSNGYSITGTITVVNKSLKHRNKTQDPSLANNALIEEVIAETKQSLLSQQHVHPQVDQYVDTDDTSSLDKAKPISNVGCLVSAEISNQSTQPLFCQGFFTDDLMCLANDGMICSEDNLDTADHLLMMTSLPSGESEYQTSDSVIGQYTTDTGIDQCKHISLGKQPTVDTYDKENAQCRQSASHTQSRQDSLTSWETVSVDTVTNSISSPRLSPQPCEVIKSIGNNKFETKSLKSNLHRTDDNSQVVFNGFETAANNGDNPIVFQGFQVAANSNLHMPSSMQEGTSIDNSGSGFESVVSDIHGPLQEENNPLDGKNKTNLKLRIKSQPAGTTTVLINNDGMQSSNISETIRQAVHSESSDMLRPKESQCNQNDKLENFITPPSVPFSLTQNDSMSWRGSLYRDSSSSQMTNSSKNYSPTSSKFLSPVKDHGICSSALQKDVNSETRLTSMKSCDSFGSVISIPTDSVPDKLTTSEDSFHSRVRVSDDSDKDCGIEFLSSDHSSNFGSPMYKSTPKRVNELKHQVIGNPKSCRNRQHFDCNLFERADAATKDVATRSGYLTNNDKPRHEYSPRKLSASNYSANHLESERSQDQHHYHRNNITPDTSTSGTPPSINLIDFRDCSSLENNTSCEWLNYENQSDAKDSMSSIVEHSMEDHGQSDEPCSKRRKTNDDSCHLFHPANLKMSFANSSSSTNSCNTSEIVDLIGSLQRVQSSQRRFSSSDRINVESVSAEQRYIDPDEKMENENVVLERMVSDNSSEYSEDIETRPELSLIFSSNSEKEPGTHYRVRSASAVAKCKHSYISRSTTSSPSTKSFFSRIVYWSSSSCSSPALSNGSRSPNNDLSHHQNPHSKVSYCQLPLKTSEFYEDSMNVGGDNAVSETRYTCSSSWSSHEEVFSNEIDYVDGYWNVSSTDGGRFHDEASYNMYPTTAPAGLDDSDANTLKHIPSIVNSSEMSRRSDDSHSNQTHFGQSQRKIVTLCSEKRSESVDSFHAVNLCESHYNDFISNELPKAKIEQVSPIHENELPLPSSSPHMMCGSDLKHQWNQNNSMTNSENEANFCSFQNNIQTARESPQNITFHDEMHPSQSPHNIHTPAGKIKPTFNQCKNVIRLHKSPDKIGNAMFNCVKENETLALSDLEKCAIYDIPNLHNRISALEDKFESISFAKPNKEIISDVEYQTFNLVHENINSHLQNMTDDEKISMPQIYVTSF